MLSVNPMLDSLPPVVSDGDEFKDVWRPLLVPDDIILALNKAQFIQPTPIQSLVLPSAIRDRSDILGSAPTGSGKTLAFGIPLLVRVKELRNQEKTTVDTSRSENPISEDVHLNTESDSSSNESVKDNPIPKSVKGNPTVKGRKTKKINAFNTSFKSANYLNLCAIEELDADTGEVRAVHSLADDPVVDEVKSKPKMSTVASKSSHHGRVYGLVLLPTRELALQVCQHLRILAEFIEPRIRIEPIVGGISIQKQTRLLSYKPDVIVATPGRLWQFIQQDDPHLCTVRQANVLVVDEADKLIEANHFDDLRELFNWLHGPSTDGHGSSTEASDAVGSGKDVKRRRTARQTIVFSATLTFVHRGALKPGTGAKHRKRRITTRGGLTKELKLGALRDLLGLSPHAKVFDLTSKSLEEPSSESNKANTVVAGKSSTAIAQAVASPEGLREYRFLCADQPSKDMRLFWFLAFGRHIPMTDALPTPSNQRCLIFLNSKSGVRRLAGVMRQLTQANAFAVSEHAAPRYVNALHADMLQKQRLRALERFQADPCGVLIASDVASRGLDLASTDNLGGGGGIAWVVHFDVPRTAELYIHRRGRTARAYRTGTSLLFVCPNEIPLWRRLALSLKRADPDLADFPLEPSHFQFTACERIVQLAKQLDLTEHSESRKRANDNWFAHAAKSADILLESDDNENDFDDAPKSKKARRSYLSSNRQLGTLRSDLQQFVLACRKSLSKKTCVQPDSIQKTTRSLKKQLKRVARQKATGSVVSAIVSDV